MTKRQLYHILNGLWAGIPWCCIRFWHEGNTGVTRRDFDPLWEVAQYVRCERCIRRGRMVSIRFNGFICGILIGHKLRWYDSDPTIVPIEEYVDLPEDSTL